MKIISIVWREDRRIKLLCILIIAVFQCSNKKSMYLNEEAVAKVNVDYCCLKVRVPKSSYIQ